MYQDAVTALNPGCDECMDHDSAVEEDSDGRSAEVVNRVFCMQTHGSHPLTRFYLDC